MLVHLVRWLLTIASMSVLVPTPRLAEVPTFPVVLDNRLMTACDRDLRFYSIALEYLWKTVLFMSLVALVTVFTAIVRYRNERKASSGCKKGPAKRTRTTGSLPHINGGYVQHLLRITERRVQTEPRVPFDAGVVMVNSIGMFSV